MRDGGIEVLDLQRHGAAVGAGIPAGHAADGQRVRPKFIFHPFAIREIGDGGGFQAQHAFVKLTGAFDVRDGVTTKCEFGDFEHKFNYLSNRTKVEWPFLIRELQEDNLSNHVPNKQSNRIRPQDVYET